MHSIDQALGLYRDVLGVESSKRIFVEHEKVEVVMVSLGDSRFELLEASCQDSVIAQFVSRYGEGLHHVAVRVPNLELVVGKMRTAGIRLVTDEIQTRANGYNYVFVHPKSANGILLELIEYTRTESSN